MQHMDDQHKGMGMDSGGMENHADEDHHNPHSGGMKVHSGHMDMMKMYFHGGVTEVILFDFWRIDSVGGLIGSMVGCFAMAVAYEAIKFYREKLFRSNIVGRRRLTRVGGGSSSTRYENVLPSGGPDEAGGHAASNEAASIEANDVVGSVETVHTLEASMFSLSHALLTGIYLVQVTLAYFLMLVFMTYNSWLCLATVLGATFGYFLFGWKKTVLYEEAEHCH